MNLTSEDHLYFETCMSLEVSKLYIQIYMYIKLTLFLKHYSTVTGVTAIMVPVDYNTSPGNQYSPPPSYVCCCPGLFVCFSLQLLNWSFWSSELQTKSDKKLACIWLYQVLPGSSLLADMYMYATSIISFYSFRVKQHIFIMVIDRFFTPSIKTLIPLK